MAVIVLATLGSQARPEEVDPEPYLLRAAMLGSEASASYGISLDATLVAGVVLGADTGKLLVLRRQSSGRYAVEAQSGEFPNSLGMRDNIETVEVPGPQRFMVQVNSRSACGIQLQYFRLARSEGRWKVAGYDRDEPDSIACDANLKSRVYSANLLTGRVQITEFSKGVPTRKYSRRSKVGAADIETFNFDIFANEP